MKELFPLKSQKGFPGGSEVKASACNAGNPGLIPESGRSLGEGNGNPLQYPCLENPMDGGVWWATVHGVAKSWTRLSDLTSRSPDRSRGQASGWRHCFAAASQAKLSPLSNHGHQLPSSTGTTGRVTLVKHLLHHAARNPGHEFSYF